VGDTVKFMWGANNHTVTKSSALTPCNRSSDSPFASGTQNKDFVFTQLVNDTKPTYFFCATATHCQKGMFGIINPVALPGAQTSVSNMMSTLISNNSDLAAYATYTSQQTAGNPAAAQWGQNIDMSSIPESAQADLAENIMYTRVFLAANPEVLNEDGRVDLGTAKDIPLSIPQDLAAALSSTSNTTPSTPAAAPTTDAPVSTPPPITENLNNGAGVVSSPTVMMGVVVAFATFLML
jgi:hypothetical protein